MCSAQWKSYYEAAKQDEGLQSEHSSTQNSADNPSLDSRVQLREPSESEKIH